jgi:hypothetical protein
MARLALCPPRTLLVYGPAALLVLAAACKDDPPTQSDGTGTSTGGTSTGGTDPGATSNLTTSPVTTVDPDDTTFGAGCGPDPCPGICGRDCPSTATCIASVWMCECDCPSTGTTGGDPCDMLDAELDTWVEPSKSPAVDCGSPGPDDAVNAWQTVHDCSSIQASNSMGLRATWTLADGADPIQYGVGGRVGEVYELAWFERSTAGLVQYSCSALVVTPDCTVDVGLPCLTCEDQTEVEVLCDEASGSSTSGSSSG